MSTVTEYFNAHMVPRLIVGQPVDEGDGATQNIDGYAYGGEYSVGTDGYVIELAQNMVYRLSTRSQDIYYGIVTSDPAHNRFHYGKTLEEMDDSEKLSLLNTGNDKNGHFLDDAVTASTGGIRIATTRLCKTLVVKAATSTATVNISPLSSIFDDPGGR